MDWASALAGEAPRVSARCWATEFVSSTGDRPDVLRLPFIDLVIGMALYLFPGCVPAEYRYVVVPIASAARVVAAIGGLGLVMLPSFAAAGDRRLQKISIKNVSVKRDLWGVDSHGLNGLRGHAAQPQVSVISAPGR